MILAARFDLQIVRGCTWEALEFQMLDGDSNPVNITGWNFAAEVRATSGDTVIVDLLPTITSAVNGIVQLPAIDDETTDTFPAGTFKWDFIGEDGSDNSQQLFKGRFKIVDKITNSG